MREKPDFNDAIEVLEGISEETGSDVLESDDLKAVIQCWFMLSDALRSDGLERPDLNADFLNRRLQDVKCVPTKQGRLHPSIMDVLRGPPWARGQVSRPARPELPPSD